MFRLETKKSLYIFGITREFTWRFIRTAPDDDFRSYWWLWFSLDWFSQEWLRFCDEHGGPPGSLLLPSLRSQDDTLGTGR